MRSGAWHQCGWNSQKMVTELLQHGAGTGVIISTRDLAQTNAADYSKNYRLLDAEVVCDLQFYNPSFTNEQLATYPVDPFRLTISELSNVSDDDLSELAQCIADINARLATSAIIAPAVVYEAQRPDIVALNQRLFEAAKVAGEQLHKPVYATVVLGTSVTANLQLIGAILNEATKLHPDGWYFAYEFAANRLPTAKDSVFRCGVALLHLARTLKPVLHAYAGPLGIASPGFGATAAGIGNFQCMWQFTRDRFADSGEDSGGSAHTATRLFSKALWGTIVYPDEVTQVEEPLRSTLITASPYTAEVTLDPPSPIDKWKAGKHLVYSICSTVADVVGQPTARSRAELAKEMLAVSVYNHRTIQEQEITLLDSTADYQANWRDAIADLLTQNSADYDYLEAFG